MHCSLRMKSLVQFEAVSLRMQSKKVVCKEDHPFGQSVNRVKNSPVAGLSDSLIFSIHH